MGLAQSWVRQFCREAWLLVHQCDMVLPEHSLEVGVRSATDIVLF